jgi:hypothetical protein
MDPAGSISVMQVLINIMEPHKETCFGIHIHLFEIL